MFRQPDIAQIPEQKTERHQGDADRRHNEVDADVFRFRNQHRRKKYRRQAECPVIETLEDEIHDVPDGLAEENAVDVENIAHCRLNRVQHTFREVGDFLRQTLFFGWIFAGVRLLFRQPAEHIFHRRGRSLRVGRSGILHRVANLREGKDHDQHHQQRTDEPDSDMLSELRVIPHNRQQENAQRHGQRKVMNARHRRCDQLLDIRG